MEEINRLHDIADDIGSTSWGYELASALHNIAADIGEKVDEMRHVLDADGMEVHKGDEVWSTTGEFDGKRTVSSVHIDPDEPPYAMFEERQKPYSCLCCYLTHQRPVFDADGVPIKKGDEVYLTDEARVLSEVPSVKGEPLVVTHFNYNRERPVCAIDQFDIENGITVPWCLKPGWITHTKPEPDSWSSVWADVSNGNESPEGMMRRCRALAERGES